jgi:hypothetical protein
MPLDTTQLTRIATDEARTRNLVHDLGCIRAGILAARADFPRLYDFYAGVCEAQHFGGFLALGDFYAEPLTRSAWRRTIHKEIDRVESLWL